MRNGIRNDMQTDNDPPYLEQRRSQVWDMHRTALYAPVRLDADTGGAPKMFNAATDNYPPVPSDGKLHRGGAGVEDNEDVLHVR